MLNQTISLFYIFYDITLQLILMRYSCRKTDEDEDDLYIY
jgi:hypothetical protein